MWKALLLFNKRCKKVIQIGEVDSNQHNSCEQKSERKKKKKKKDQREREKGPAIEEVIVRANIKF